MLIYMQQMNSEELSSKSLKQLKFYIQAYNLAAKHAIEKDDLVRIILNTRPISNESEVYYRANKSRLADKRPVSNNNDMKPSDDQEFSFSNIFQDIFGGGQSPSPQPTSIPGQSMFQDLFGQPSPSAANTPRTTPSRSQPRPPNPSPQQPPSWQQTYSHSHTRPPPPTAQYRSNSRPTYQSAPRQPQQPRYPQTARPPTTPSTPANNASVPPSGPAHRPPPPRAAAENNTISLDDLIRSKIDPSSLSVRTLKAILRANFVEQSHVLEKSELVTRVQRLANERKEELKASDSSVNEDSQCRICMDAQQNCVFLDCGHMVTCMSCGKKLIETKNECPICREPILKLIHVFRS
ncbi:zinc finger, C3HC4 type-domain-containing protein [Radiomyces spectabilis]|uniref:zinc finger, C3HC4 type-domain-containing protein n=1 Tax=Radiomyces spectabilis TaxID=64574 RepID=UPI00221FAC1D|nr:zinc finger, C3HC4 type-domain-containing protein [Radiomyces spectabilis]KAI8388652.1 zinc finger, C3HC4 type-domain-containing protein [Radiomyces spectabilis]